MVRRGNRRTGGKANPAAVEEPVNAQQVVIEKTEILDQHHGDEDHHQQQIFVHNGDDGTLEHEIETEEHVEVDVEGGEDVQIAVDDDVPPLLMPQKMPPDEIPTTTVQQYVAENGETSYIEVADGYADEAYYVEGDLGDVKPEDYIVDPNNVCCGICGEVMPYDTLMAEHLPAMHPEVLADGEPDFEEVSYDVWLKDRMEKSHYGYDEHGYYEMQRHHNRANRPLRRVSQIRVKTSTMTLDELESSLKKKMVEKLGRSVPVTLVDKQHARCGICNAVVSLNKKFEIVHLVRHFNAWHPSAHKCAGQWGKQPGLTPGYGKPLSAADIAVIDTQLGAHDNLQCIWCGMFMDGAAVGMHFHEVHPDEIEVPKCNLCLQEVLINARLTERYGDHFDVVLPDERHYKSLKYNSTHSSENALEKAIVRNMQREQNGEAPPAQEEDDEEDDVENMKRGPAGYSNSRMTFGRRSKPKRHFVMPSLRQAVPVDSQYVEPVTDCHWKCKLCGKDILAAVISAGTIRHYRDHHPNELSDCQMELCKTRLERLSDGCMEFLNPNEIECLICQMTYPLHKPFNMCRAVRHLKAKHPQQMPEYEGTAIKVEPMAKKRRIEREIQPEGEDVTAKYEITDPATLEDLRDKYKVEFTKVLDVRTSGNDQVYILVNSDTRIDQHAVDQVLIQIEATEPRYDGTPFVVQYAPHAEDEEGMEEIPEEHYVEEQEVHVKTEIDENVSGMPSSTHDQEHQSEMEATHDQDHVESTENVEQIDVKAAHNDEHHEVESSQIDEETNS
jgi:hypothetical protein